ncbi:hypothetical protein OSR38_01325 [Rickettsia conorii subsp. heilongjiangensis]|nr:hypothetical protein OSR38_01325 [Rickettsia conorii subsp. heilongjiangensis]
MTGEARADIEIYDILNHTADYQILPPAQKLNVIKGIQDRIDFGDLVDDLMPGESRLFNNAKKSLDFKQLLLYLTVLEKEEKHV